MDLFQILSCSDVGTCCGNYAMANFLDLGRRMISLVQLFVPIVLIGACIFQLVKLVINPDEKAGIKKITNKLIAAVVVFFIPIVFDISLGVLPEDFSFSACWNTAKSIREVSKASQMKYIALSSEKAKSIIYDPDEYEKGVKKPAGSGSGGAGGVGAQKMVNTGVLHLLHGLLDKLVILIRLFLDLPHVISLNHFLLKEQLFTMKEIIIIILWLEI